jgi:hypothetical protein
MTGRACPAGNPAPSGEVNVIASTFARTHFWTWTRAPERARLASLLSSFPQLRASRAPRSGRMNFFTGQGRLHSPIHSITGDRR